MQYPRTNVQPLTPTLTFHKAFGSQFTLDPDVSRFRAMAPVTAPTHHFSLVKWATKITVYDEDTRHVVADLRWKADEAGVEDARAWFRSIHGQVVEGRRVVVTFKGRWA